MAKAPLAFKRVGIDFTVTGADRLHELGIEIPCVDGKVYKYIRAGAAIAVGDALKVDYAEGLNDFDPTSAATSKLAGVAEVAIADNEYGFVVVKGTVVAKLSGSTAANAGLIPSATAGTLGTAADTAAAALVAATGLGALCVVAESGGTGTVKLL